MQLKNILVGFVLSSSLGACVVQGHARVVAPQPIAVVEVEEEPPPPQTRVIEVRSGYLWIEGRWDRVGGRWSWRDGHYERERANQIWEQGRWERRGNRHIWVEGRWTTGSSGPVVRDHRETPPPPPPGPVVRDHRN